MSLCLYKHIKSGPAKPKSLPGHLAGKQKTGNGTPLFTCKGSYTVEAAIVIPLSAVFLMTILFFFRVLQVQEDLQQALMYAGRIGAVSSEKLALGVAEGTFRSKLRESDAVSTYVKNGRLGVSTLGSKQDGDYLVLHASCQIPFPINIFGLSDIRILAVSKNRFWSGHTEGEQEEDPLVYYTPTGTVYHRTKSCPYLDLSIHSVEYQGIGLQRNKSGHKYYPCSECSAGQETLENVFITEYGTVYHTELGCSGLKRTVLEIRLSQVGSRPVCSKCGG